MFDAGHSRLLWSTHCIRIRCDWCRSFFPLSILILESIFVFIPILFLLERDFWFLPNVLSILDPTTVFKLHMVLNFQTSIDVHTRYRLEVTVWGRVAGQASASVPVTHPRYSLHFLIRILDMYAAFGDQEHVIQM